MSSLRRSAVALLALAACHDKPAPAAGEAVASASAAVPTPAVALRRLTARPLPLPGATAPAFLDYIAFEPAHARVWVPVGSTGSVDVLDVVSGKYTRVDGFATAEKEVRGKVRTVGPSAAAVGDGFVYVGDRATNEVCPVDVRTLALAPCLKLPEAIDGVAYVASAHEVWVTAPAARSLLVLDAASVGAPRDGGGSALRQKAVVKLDGAPEGYAVDEGRGLFFTNLEDKGGTVVVDVKTHAVQATWSAGCGADGPRGLAMDEKRGLLVVACTDKVQVLDAAHGGALRGALDAGEGIDNLDLVEGKLYVAAGKAARLTVASLDDRGQLTVRAVGESAPGARNAVADSLGNAYVADSAGARLLAFAGAGR